MAYKYYDGPSEFRPMNAWAYVGYTILYAIPVIGWIFLIVNTFNSSNYNRRAFARSYWCWLLLLVIVFGIFAIALVIKDRLVFDKRQQVHDQINSLLKEPIVQQETNAPEETKAPTVTKSSQTTTVPKETPTATPTATTRTNTGAVNPEFKKTMDAYEAFFDDYVDFMKTFDGSDLSQLSQYTTLMAQYAETFEALDEIDDDDLSATDAAYYLEVYGRIMQKLASIAE